MKPLPARPLAFLLMAWLATHGVQVLAEDCPTLYEQARKTRGTAPSQAAFASCSELAKKGDATGRFVLGMLKIDGIGTAIDPQGGLQLIRQAAESGLGAAQARLGRMHLRGVVVDVDPAAAAGWFERAALGGEPLAQYELGQLRYKGSGVEADAYEAYKWFTAAAENFSRAGNVPRQKLAERKRETVAAELPAAERERAEAWVASEPGILRND